MNANDWEGYTSFKISNPSNLFTKKNYQGFNILALYLDTLVKGFTTSYYATFQSISNAGGKLKKGAKGCVIEFFTFIYKDENSKKIIPNSVVQLLSKEEINALHKQPIIKNYVVFNSECIENFSDLNLDLEKEIFDMEEFSGSLNCENFISRILNNGLLNLKFSNTQTAFYSPSLDLITMPRKEMFLSSDKYYSTLFHEVIHWTGNANRLYRDLKGHSDLQSYSFEEVIAEMGSMLCCLQFGVLSEFLNSIRYLKGWILANKLDKEILLRKAFTESKKAKKFLESY